MARRQSDNSMPELPEVETTKQGIRKMALHQRVMSIAIHQPHLRYPIPDNLEHLLTDQCIMNVTRRGKYILLHFHRGCLLLHLGMSGSIVVLVDTHERKKHDHFEMFLEDRCVLRFNDPRRFGCVLWCTDAEQHPLLKKLGPEPLHALFNADYLAMQARKRRIAIKQLIMDPCIVVGVGNIYASEALFLAGIRPQRAAHGITDVEHQRLVHAIKAVLKQAIQQGGTTLRNYTDHTGKPGYFAQQLQVYGQVVCQKCSSSIVRIILGQRRSFYCPVCQR